MTRAGEAQIARRQPSGGKMNLIPFPLTEASLPGPDDCRWFVNRKGTS